MISPVMATSERTSRPLKSEARQVTMVTPADGPSFVTAPAGKCRWMSVLSRRSKLPEAKERKNFNVEKSNLFSFSPKKNKIREIKTNVLGKWRLQNVNP